MILFSFSKRFIILVIVVNLLLTSSCTSKNTQKNSDASRLIIEDELFSFLFLNGDYAIKSEKRNELKLLFVTKPTPKLARHLATLYFWSYAERFHLRNTLDINILEQLILAKYYFNESLTGDSKSDQFAEDTLKVIDYFLANAFYKSKKQSKKVLEVIKDQSILDNHFYGLAVLGFEPNSKEEDSELLNKIYEGIDDAFDINLQVKNEEFVNQLVLLIKHKDRGNYNLFNNSFLAPYSLQGFLLYFGDFLLKNRQATKAKVVYEIIDDLPRTANWPFHELVDSRIEMINYNEVVFQQPLEQRLKLEQLSNSQIVSKTTILNTNSCMVCHQAN